VAAAITLQERVDSLVDEVSQLKTQWSTMTAQNHSRDGATATAAAAQASAQLLQQAFVNFTRHIYRLEDDARRARLHCSIIIIIIIIIIIKGIYIAQVHSKFARATNALCRQRWQYDYVTVYVSIAVNITNYQDS